MRVLVSDPSVLVDLERGSPLEISFCRSGAFHPWRHLTYSRSRRDETHPGATRYLSEEGIRLCSPDLPGHGVIAIGRGWLALR